MSEENESDDAVIWGIPVVTADNGRRVWPDALKAMAAEKVAAGAKILEIAKEVGANKSLVAKWVNARRPAERGDDSPKFVEVSGPREPHGTMRKKEADEAAVCRIRIGDAEVSLDGDFPTSQLADILRAVRASQ